MASGLVQAQRTAILTTPLGEDVLVLTRFDGHESIGRLFEFRIDALSEQGDIDFDGAIGQNCCVSLTVYDQTRHFNGVLVEAQWLGPRNDNYAYRLLLRPWFWLLSRTTDCRIFEDQSVLDIIKQVFSDRGFNDFSDKTTKSYSPIPYCVQYRETDMDFISRLMEEYGIYYFFEHSQGKHMLVMADSKSSHQALQDLGTLPFIALAGADRRDRQHVHDWSTERRFRTGKVTLKDYDYLKPSAKVESDANGTAGYKKSDMEFYDYARRYFKQSDGDAFAKVRLEAEQALDQRRFGTGLAPSIMPGGLTTLKDQIKGSENIQYLVMGATHGIVTESYRSGADGVGEQVYHGAYEFLPADQPYRSPLSTPRPLVYGPQTAVVVGQSGEEIDVDKYGRILVQFNWDRKKMQSCRVRIAQVVSGKAWGGIFIPRIGQEVVVEFLEGNPDKPLVTGTVYNADNKVPYTLPDNKTKSGWKTDSSKGHNGYNELVFEDKADSEQIGIHAQKDLDIVVLNSETREIGENFMPPMGSPSRSTTLHNGDDELTLEMGDQKITLEMGSQTVSIMMNQTTTANMAISTSAMLSQTLQVTPLTTIAMSPAAIADTSPMISLTAMGTITLTAPIINLVGIVNVTGLLTVNGMIPMLLPA